MRGWAGWFLLACAVLPFASARHGGNVHDDHFLRGAGSLVADVASPARVLWRADVFGTPDRPSGQSGFWRPLVLLSFRAEFLLTGGAEAPFAWLSHVTNLLLHGLATWLLWRLLLRLDLPPAAALLAATLFAVHPVHAETVAWMSSRGDLGAFVLATLATLLLLRRDAPGPGAWRDVPAAAALMVGALLFKETAAILVASAVLPVRWRGRSWASALAAPALALGVYGALRAASFTRAIAPDAYTGPAKASVRCWTWLSTLPDALRLVTWPGPASPLHPVAAVDSWSRPDVLGGAAVLVLLGGLAAWAWRRREAALGWGLVVLVVALLMLAPWARYPTGYPEIAAPFYERYFYAAAVLPGLAAAWLCRRWLDRAPRLAAAVTVAAAALIGPRAAAAGAAWVSDEAYARAGLAAAPGSANLWNHLGLSQLEILRQRGERGAGGEALAAFDRALAREPGQLQAAINRFITLAMLGREDDATYAAHFLLRDHPDDPDVLDNVAQWHAAHQRWQDAADLFGREIETGRAHPGADRALGECLRALEPPAAPAAAGAEGGT